MTPHPSLTDPDHWEKTERLGHGEAVPGGPGACGGCHHAKVWHRHGGKRPCERCDCRAWTGEVSPRPLEELTFDSPDELTLFGGAA